MSTSIDPDLRASRRTAMLVALVSGVGFVLVAWAMVPWHPVPGGAVEAIPASSVFSADQVERADVFARQVRGWSWASLLVSLVVSSVLGFTVLGRRLVERLPGGFVARTVLATFVVLLVGRLVTLPFALAVRTEVQAQGLSHQSLPGYLRDLAVSFGVTWVVTSIALLVLLGAVRRWARAWPAVAAGVLASLVMLGSFVYPVVVEPLFNHFESLADGPLRAEILRLADTEDVRVDDVLVADASRRTTTLNAYVSGYGDTRRVVVYDNLVRDLPQGEAMSVVAHELAHARHHDVVTGSVLGALGVAFSMGLLGLVLSSGGVRRRWALVGGGEASEPPSAGLSRAASGSTAAALVPLVLALSAWGTLLAEPVGNGISRQVEIRADVDALHATQDPEAFISMQRQLALRSLADPEPPVWSQWWFGSHPTVLERIAVARRMMQEPS